DQPPSSCPTPSPTSPAGSFTPTADTPPPAPAAPHRGCFPAGSPAARSAPPTSDNASKTSASGPAKHAAPRCSNSPPNFPPPCLPACSASTSTSPSSGNTPAPATGPPTPPTSAAARPLPVADWTIRTSLRPVVLTIAGKDGYVGGVLFEPVIAEFSFDHN